MRTVANSAAPGILFVENRLLGKQPTGQAASEAMRMVGSKPRLPGFRFFLCHVLALQPQATYFPSMPQFPLLKNGED